MAKYPGDFFEGGNFCYSWVRPAVIRERLPLKRWRCALCLVPCALAS